MIIAVGGLIGWLVAVAFHIMTRRAAVSPVVRMGMTVACVAIGIMVATLASGD